MARKVKGTIHWVAAQTALKAEVRLYENLVDEEKGKLNAGRNAELKSEFSARSERVLLRAGSERGKSI